MQQAVLFTEDQKFKQWWVWLIILSMNGFFLSMVYQQLILKKQVGDRPMADTGLLIASGTILLVTLLFFYTRFSTRIKKDGIYVKFFPFQFSYKHYNWEMVAKAYIRTYSPLGEYGGWGLRYSISGKGMAYNVSGNKGLQLELNTGKKILIGTNKAAELEAVLNQLNA
ncbi:DUF6141 family protein [Pedobacter heparinus]|uniref:DUF6141 family protein n=1 Tax=Pedobacter heparinus TaxID=984 RepID=UPI002930B05A|nr:DUF6141 family protein [Pedobacter heparinus]